jgi:hypothetical protein
MMSELVKQHAARVKVACELRPACAARRIFNDAIHDELNPRRFPTELRMVSAYDLLFTISPFSPSKLR